MYHLALIKRNNIERLRSVSLYYWFITESNISHLNPQIKHWWILRGFVDEYNKHHLVYSFFSLCMSEYVFHEDKWKGIRRAALGSFPVTGSVADFVKTCGDSSLMTDRVCVERVYTVWVYVNMQPQSASQDTWILLKTLAVITGMGTWFWTRQKDFWRVEQLQGAERGWNWRRVAELLVAWIQDFCAIRCFCRIHIKRKSRGEKWEV